MQLVDLIDKAFQNPYFGLIVIIAAATTAYFLLRER